MQIVRHEACRVWIFCESVHFELRDGEEPWIFTPSFSLSGIHFHFGDWIKVPVKCHTILPAAGLLGLLPEANTDQRARKEEKFLINWSGPNEKTHRNSSWTQGQVARD